MWLVVLPDRRVISVLIELWYVVVYINYVHPDRCVVVSVVVTGGCCYDNQSMTLRCLVVQ